MDEETTGELANILIEQINGEKNLLQQEMDKLANMKQIFYNVKLKKDCLDKSKKMSKNLEIRVLLNEAA